MQGLEEGFGGENLSFSGPKPLQTKDL